MSKYTRGLLAVILAVVLVLPAAAFAMLPEANARSSTGMDGPTVSGTVVDPDTSGQIMENLLALPCMVVAITHDVSGAFMKQFDKVYRVEHGSVTQA